VSSGIEVLPDATMAMLLGELNTESRCVLATATPNELVPVQYVREDLMARNALGLVSRERFNLNSIVNSFSPAIISKSKDPLDGSVWIQRGITQPADSDLSQDPSGAAQETTNPVGDFIAGMSGSLLAFSAKYGIPLRSLVGEKHAPKKHGISATEIRLGVVATVVRLAQTGQPFTGNQIREYTEDLDLMERPVRSHLSDLVKYGYLQCDDSKRPKVYHTVELPDRTDTQELMTDFLRIVGEFAIGSIRAQEDGIQRGQQILDDSVLLPRLIQKSYDASGHTGKSFTRRVV